MKGLLMCGALIFSLGLLSWHSATFDSFGVSGWSEPVILFEREEEPEGFKTSVIADQTGTVHLFCNQLIQSQDAPLDHLPTSVIFYAAFRSDAWEEPNDILLDAGMPLGLDISSEGTLHIATNLVFGLPYVAYLHVDASQAADPRAWSRPTYLDLEGAGWRDLAADSKGNIYIVYSQRDQKAIAIVKSADGGRSWSQPSVVASAPTGDLVGFPRLALGPGGVIHLIWGELPAPDGYPWQGIRYARSPDGGDTWSLPFTLAEAHQGEPNMAAFGDQVFVVWNGDAGYKNRFFRMSADGGASWYPTEKLPIPAPLGGLQGRPAIVVDGMGAVHILYTNGPTLYYICRRGAEWSPPVLLATDSEECEVIAPQLAITQGNRLHAFYTVWSPQVTRLYYRHCTIGAPELEPSPWPGSESAPFTAAPTKEESIERATPDFSLSSQEQRVTVGSPHSDRATFWPVVAGVLVSLLFLLPVMVAHLVHPQR